MSRPSKIPSRSTSEDITPQSQDFSSPKFKFRCDECPKRFTRRHALHEHIRTHNDERPFACGLCGRAFTRERGRKRHEHQHSGEKHFKCRGTLEDGYVWGCGRRFTRADVLNAHLRSETGKKCILRDSPKDTQEVQDVQPTPILTSAGTSKGTSEGSLDNRRIFSRPVRPQSRSSTQTLASTLTAAVSASLESNTPSTGSDQYSQYPYICPLCNDYTVYQDHDLYLLHLQLSQGLLNMRYNVHNLCSYSSLTAFRHIHPLRKDEDSLDRPYRCHLCDNYDVVRVYQNYNLLLMHIQSSHRPLPEFSSNMKYSPYRLTALSRANSLQPHRYINGAVTKKRI